MGCCQHGIEHSVSLEGGILIDHLRVSASQEGLHLVEMIAIGSIQYKLLYLSVLRKDSLQTTVTPP
jgi:hypothetical protein